VKKLPIPRWVLILIATLPAGIAIGIFFFIARFSMAHDETRCPFQQIETRVVSSSAIVREDSRQCLPEVEEHRWVLLRQGQREIELGRYPLESEQIERGFPWQATLEEGRVVVTVTNEGRGDIVFREPAPDGGMTEFPARME
jgi:hypothetical protein